MTSNLRQFCAFLVLLGVNAAVVPPKYMSAARCEFRPYIFSDEKIKRLVVTADTLPHQGEPRFISKYIRFW